MERKEIHQMLKLVVDPRATTQQLQSAMDRLVADIEASAAYNRANPLPPPPSPEERLIAARRAANANLAKRYKR